MPNGTTSGSRMTETDKSEELTQKQEEEPVESINLQHEMVDWWMGTVILAFFPIIVSIVIGLLREGRFNLNRMIGDGELIISAFLVITPSLINSFKEASKHKVNLRNFYLLLFVAFFQLVAYVAIKTNPTNIPIIVYVASALCVCSSIIISRQCELFFKKEGG